MISYEGVDRVKIKCYFKPAYSTIYKSHQTINYINYF